MKATNEKVYRCDFCRKPMVRAGLMKIHERMCKKNPKNMHKCFEYCIYLEKTVLEADIPVFDEDPYSPREIKFKCTNEKCDLFDKELYSYKLERYERKRNRLEGLIRMPLECKHFRDDSPEPEF